MTFEPLISAPLTIQIHVAAALGALLLGPIAILRKSRDRLHKTAGYLWIMSLVATAISSFWISGMPVLGPFGPIHILSVFTLWGVADALRAAWQGRIAAHRAGMTMLYIYALCLTAMFTLLPGRLMNRVIFDGAGGWGLIGLIVGIAAVVVIYRNRGVLPLGKVRGLL